jgi:hypothetical protein
MTTTGCHTLHEGNDAYQFELAGEASSFHPGAGRSAHLSFSISGAGLFADPTDYQD